MVNLKERKRKVDVEKLSVEQAEKIGVELGNKLNEIVDEAVAKSNKILEVYGCKAIMQLEVKQITSTKE
jgi:hypothetical protein